jgi:prephenate dehydrogenase
MFKHVFVLH